MSLTKLTAPPYKNRSNGWHSRQLFWEEWQIIQIKDRVIEPVFTFHTHKPGLICGRTTFVEMGDPTGYKWAMEYLGDYAHWVFLMKSSWFRDAVEVWQNELEMKNTAEAVEAIKNIALDPTNKSALPAARYLAEQGWKKNKRGRPSTETVNAELKRAVRERTQEDDDADRIGLKLVKS